MAAPAPPVARRADSPALSAENLIEDNDISDEEAREIELDIEDFIIRYKENDFLGAYAGYAERCLGEINQRFQDPFRRHILRALNHLLHNPKSYRLREDQNTQNTFSAHIEHAKETLKGRNLRVVLGGILFVIGVLGIVALAINAKLFAVVSLSMGVTIGVAAVLALVILIGIYANKVGRNLNASIRSMKAVLDAAGKLELPLSGGEKVARIQTRREVIARDRADSREVEALAARRRRGSGAGARHVRASSGTGALASSVAGSGDASARALAGDTQRSLGVRHRRKAPESGVEMGSVDLGVPASALMAPAAAPPRAAPPPPPPRAAAAASGTRPPPERERGGQSEEKRAADVGERERGGQGGLTTGSGAPGLRYSDGEASD